MSSSALTEGPEAEVGSNYAFVMNVAKLVGGTSFTLAPGHLLRRANAQEVSFIRQTLEAFERSSMPLAWESQVLPGGQVTMLPEEEWKYFVISFQGSNQTVVDLEQAMSRAPLELKIGLTAVSHLIGGQTHPGVIYPGRLFLTLEHTWAHLNFFDVGLRM